MTTTREQVLLGEIGNEYALRHGEAPFVKHVRNLGKIKLNEGDNTSREAVTKRGWKRLGYVALTGVTAAVAAHTLVPVVQDAYNRMHNQDATCEQLEQNIDSLKAQGITDGSEQMTTASIEFVEAGCAQPL